MNKRIAGSIVLIVVLVATDALMNLSRAITFSNDLFGQVTWGCVAVCLAIVPSWISYHGDHWSRTIGMLCCAGSIMFSYLAVESFVQHTANFSTDTTQSRALLRSGLEGKEQKIAACRADRYCDSQAMRADYANKEAQLLALPTVTAPPANQQQQVWISFFFALLLPISAAELSRQLGTYQKTELKAGQQAVREPKTVPKLGTFIKKFGTKRRKVPRSWSQAQLKRMENAYSDMIKNGIKPSATKISEAAIVSKQIACKWFKEGEKPNVIALKTQSSQSSPQR